MEHNSGGRSHVKGLPERHDFVFVTQMEPNLHWTEAEAERRLYALIEEGKIQEIERPGSGKFRPTEKLSSSAGSTFKG